MHILNSPDGEKIFPHISCFIRVYAAYIQTTRALMIIASILGLVAVVMLLLSMPCINIGNQSCKNRHTLFGGVLVLLVGKKLRFVAFRMNQGTKREGHGGKMYF